MKDEQVNKSLVTQIAKYGGEEGYRAEMVRRRALVKKPGFASMDQEKRRLAAQKGGINSGINYRKQKDGQKENTSSEV